MYINKINFIQGTYEKNHNYGLNCNNSSYVSVQGKEKSNNITKISSNPKGGIIMKQKNISFNIIFKIMIYFNLAISGNFLV